MLDETRIGKLVRDRIPDLIRADGGNPTVKVLSEDEYLVALRAKLEEEVGELLAASADHVAEEMADVLEVLTALAVAFGLAWDVVLATGDNKRDERGGFVERLWLAAKSD